MSTIFTATKETDDRAGDAYGIAFRDAEAAPAGSVAIITWITNTLGEREVTFGIILTPSEVDALRATLLTAGSHPVK